MAFVVTESCVRCKYTQCVTVCPVDCFHEGPNMLVIDSEVCIHCGLCVPECPVNAIVAEDGLSPQQHHLRALNARLAAKWPLINQQKAPLADAEQWKNVSNKLDHLKE